MGIQGFRGCLIGGKAGIVLCRDIPSMGAIFVSMY